MNKNILRQFAVIFTTIFALVANGSANALPLNGRLTGEISDSFNVLFVPAGYVFAIWGVIYLGLTAFTIYHSLPSQRENPRMQKIGWLVALSNLANGAWIFFWHYGNYAVTLIVMLILLAALIAIYLNLGIGKHVFTKAETWLVSVPFSVYLGWITVATIANVTAVASWLGWDGSGVDPQIWVLVLLGAGVVIAALMAFTRADLAYLLVLVWAFIGISIRWPELTLVGPAGYIAAGFVTVLALAGLVNRKMHPLTQSGE